MKKATKKAAKKAVAKKAAKKVAKKAVVKKAAKKAAVKKTVAKKAPAKKAAKKAVAKKAAVKKTAAKKAPAKKKATSKAASKTVVVANIDVGFGNMLYLRGAAPGLSWKKGVPMDNKSASVWSIAMTGVKDIFEYKVLINDIHWAVGGNNIAKPGVTNSTNPTF